MKSGSQTTTQMLVFLLVATGFTAVHITQPVLPVIEEEFSVDARTASLSVSMVIFGIALANLPFGMLADRLPIKPIVLIGGAVIAITSLSCALTHSFALLIGSRFVQGLFMPSLTTCIAAYLAQNLPAAQLNVVMGSYCRGNHGRRVERPAAWRLDSSAAALALRVCKRRPTVDLNDMAAYVWLPQETLKQKTAARQASFVELLAQPGLLRMFAVASARSSSSPRFLTICLSIFPNRRLARPPKSSP
jgi:MFS transporter, YNFM family, putative membrane transport protein